MIRIGRVLKIFHLLGSQRLDTLLPQDQLPFWAKCLFALNPWRWCYRAERPRAERVRLALEGLGPIFIKFGQLLSTRRDLLPDDLADQLALLQDRVPPFASDQAVAIIEASLGRSIEQLFLEFDRTPIASASVAQVHGARLPNGESVVVKVIRPGIEKTIRQDLALLYLLARLVRRISVDGRRLRPVEVVRDYEHTILDELDLQREGANASQLKRNFVDSTILYVPRIYWDYTARSVLVMERIHGVPISDLKRLHAAGTDMKKLAERGVEIFFTQVFRDSFFHADMHPGNIFVDLDNPAEPQYIAIDCGIVGSLSSTDQSYLARNLLAFFQQDYRRVAQLHIDSGWVPRDTPVIEFEGAIRTVCEPIFEKPLKDISFGQVLVKLFQIARRFNMEVQPQLVLLEKTLLNVEGLGRQLYPELDLWQTAKPFLERWMHQRVGPRGLIRRLRAEAPELIEQAPELAQRWIERLREPEPAAPVRPRRWPRNLAVLALTLAAAGLLSPHGQGHELVWTLLGGLGLGLLLQTD